MKKSLSEKEKSKIALIIICFFWIVFTVFLMLFTQLELAVLFSIILAIMIVLPASYAHFKYSRELDMKEHVTYIGGTTLFLKKRGPVLSSTIKVSAHRHYTVSYKPDEYIYTGASSGGIAMGSVEKIDGYNYISNSKKTGQYFIEYSGNMIKDIILDDDELLQEAKKSKIAKYLDGRKITVISSVISATTRLLLENGQTDMAANMLDIDSSRGYGFPTYEKCIEIRNWICGID